MRILLATTNATGHFAPLVPVARACLRAGHDLLVAGPAGAERLVRDAELPFRAIGEPSPEAIAAARGPMATATADEAVELALRELFGRAYAGAALPGMVAVMEEWRPDLVVRETAEFASGVAADHLGIPHVRVGIGLTTANEDYALAIAAPVLDELRERIGAPADPGAVRARSAPCVTQAPPALEPSGLPEPTWVRRFRAPDPGPAEPLPDWWDGAEDPLVLVSFGTVAPSRERPWFPGLYRTVVDGLAELPVRVLVTVGRDREPAELGAVAPSVLVRQWVPQAAVMPHAAAMVAHGGAGTTLAALAAGVPMALVPLFADQPHNARRIAELGAGLHLHQPSLTPAAVQAAVHRLLDDPRFAGEAGRIGREIGRLPDVDTVVEGLVAAGVAP